MASMIDLALIVVFILALLIFIIVFGLLSTLSFRAMNFASMDEAYRRHQRWK